MHLVGLEPINSPSTLLLQGKKCLEPLYVWSVVTFVVSCTELSA